MTPNPTTAPTVNCQVCGKSCSLQDAVPGRMVRSSVADLIRLDHPDWSEEGYVCTEDLNQNLNLEFDGRLTLGERVADAVATVIS